MACPFLISKTDLMSTHLPHLQGVNLPMAIWNLQLLRRMLTTNCLRSPALSLLLIPAVLTYKEGPYQDRPLLCPFRLLPLLIYSGSVIAFLKLQGPKSKNIGNTFLLQP